MAQALKRVERLQQDNDIGPDTGQPLAYWVPDDWLKKLQPLGLVLVSDWWRCSSLAPGQMTWWRQAPGLEAVTAKAIERRQGHSSIATTSHYVHADKDARHEAFSEGFSGK